MQQESEKSLPERDIFFKSDDDFRHREQPAEEL
jgi:hypothetical protein